jgi:8-oxo-dGTP pyrophosphatase MutT (NUDIX family)
MTNRLPLTADAFLARAAEALARRNGLGATGGDHVLNPDMTTDGLRLRDAAVLIPIVAREPEATVLLTQRTAGLPTHAGQIAFPGGKIETDDPTAAAAALREAEEEVGLDPTLVRVVAELPPYLSRTGFRIAPVLGRVAAEHVLTLNLSEVTEAFEVPLGFLLDPANHRKGSRTFAGRERYFWEIPYEGRYIWGVTAGIIRGLYEQVGR